MLSLGWSAIPAQHEDRVSARSGGSSRLWNVVAVALSALALACSTFLAVQQSVLMRRANHIPAYIDLTR